MIKPITARVQAATQAGLPVTEPILNVGEVHMSRGDLPTKKSSPAKNMNKGYGTPSIKK